MMAEQFCMQLAAILCGSGPIALRLCLSTVLPIIVIIILLYNCKIKVLLTGGDLVQKICGIMLKTAFHFLPKFKISIVLIVIIRLPGKAIPGGRRGEIMGLKWDKVDLSSRSTIPHLTADYMAGEKASAKVPVRFFSVTSFVKSVISRSLMFS